MTTTAPSRTASVASASIAGLRYRVELGDPPRCECPSFWFHSGGMDSEGRSSCKHLRAALSRGVLWIAPEPREHTCKRCGAPVA